MPKFNMTIGHNLSQDEALARIKGLLGEVKTEFADKVSNLKEDWSGNRGIFSFSAMGFNVSGVITVHESGVDLAGKFPFAALPFKGKIEATIRERAEKLLG